jgi:hypothetical protein
MHTYLISGDYSAATPQDVEGDIVYQAVGGMSVSHAGTRMIIFISISRRVSHPSTPLAIYLGLAPARLSSRTGFPKARSSRLRIFTRLCVTNDAATFTIRELSVVHTMPRVCTLLRHLFGKHLYLNVKSHSVQVSNRSAGRFKFLQRK